MQNYCHQIQQLHKKVMNENVIRRDKTTDLNKTCSIQSASNLQCNVVVQEHS